MIGVGDVKKGIILKFGQDLYEVVDYERFKLGKGNSEARIRLRLRDLRSGLPSERVFQTSDHLPRVQVEFHAAQFLYSDGELYYFMDEKSYEQMALDREQLKAALPYLKDGTVVEILVHEGQPVTVHLPTAVELEVVETEPGFKGDTAVSGTKPARLETGLVVQVPLFVSSGHRVKIDTRTGQYLERGG